MAFTRKARQHSAFGFGRQLTTSKGGGDTYPYQNAEVAAYVRRFPVQPDSTRKGLIDTFVGSIKTAGCLALLDVLYIAQADGQSFRQNVVQNAFNATPVNSPSYVADRGYAGDGSSAYLDTGFNPSTAASSKYALGTAQLGVYSLTELTAANVYEIGNSSVGTIDGINPRHSSPTTMRGGVNGTTANNFGAGTSAIGDFSIHQTTPTNLNGYINGVNVGSASITQTGALVNANMTICRAGALSGQRRIGEARIGADFNDTQEAAFHSALTTYLHAIGAI